ncbi:MAG: heme exporter protein CcmB [Acidobacteriota bacterium]
MNYLLTIAAIVQKDIRSELRTKEMVASMFLFSVLVLLIFNFTLSLDGELALELGPGILWVAFIFSGSLGLNRSFASERENRSLHGLMLAPVDRSAIYFGKLISNVLFMLVAEVFLLPLFMVFFNLNLLVELEPAAFLTFLLVVAVGTVGYAAVGTTLAAIAANTTMREVLLPVLLFPVAIPVVIGAAEATRLLFQNDPFTSPWFWIRLLTVFAVIFLALSWMTFEYVLEE